MRNGGGPVVCFRWRVDNPLRNLVDNIDLNRGRAFFFVAFALVLLAPIGVEKVNPVADRVLDAAHVPIMALFSLCFFFSLDSLKYSFQKRLLISFVTSPLVALVIEIVQPVMGRTGSLSDFVNGFLGVVLALLGVALWPKRRNKKVAYGYLGLTCFVFVVAMLPAVRALEAMKWRWEHFPTLGKFEEKIELLLWRPEGGGLSLPKIVLSDQEAQTGKQSLKISVPKGGSGGVVYSAGEEGWDNFTLLKFSVFNPGEDFLLSIRIDDDGNTRDYEGRFNTQLAIKRGWNNLYLPIAFIEDGPKSRKLNLQGIKRIIFFIAKDSPTREFFLDSVRLED